MVGFSIVNVNMDLFSMIVNTLVVVALYIISFYTIEKRQIQKEINAKTTASILMKATYKDCSETLDLLNNKEMLKRYIVPKIDFDKTLLELPIEQNLINQPFNSFEQILQLAEGGHIESTALERYLNIKKEFRFVVEMKITFFDIDSVENKTKDQIELERLLTTRFETLYRELQIEVQR